MPKANAIHERVAHFIQKWPPFHLLKEEQLRILSENITIRFSEKDEILFKEGDFPDSHFYLVRQGSVKITAGSDNELIDICDEGDLFGIRALIAKDNYVASAITDEQTLLYQIPVIPGLRLLLDDPKVSNYFTTTFASGGTFTGTPFRAIRFRKSIDSLNYSDEPTLYDIETLSLDGKKPLITCNTDQKIREAAEQMSTTAAGSVIIVNGKGYPIGIITDRDIRNRVATGQISIDDSVQLLMSQPVVTATNNLPLAEYLIIMLRHRIHHICITEDGTSESPAIGMVTEHDLLLEQGQQPAVILRELRETTVLKDIKRLIDKSERLFERLLNRNLPIASLLQISTATYDHLTCHLIDLAIKENSTPPPCRFAWIALGSHGRGEQVIRTDQDHALIVEEDGHLDYFLNIAESVSMNLESIGFEKDKAGIMANNKMWCVSLTKWKDRFRKWLQQPDPDAVMHTTIFFDFRTVYGDIKITEELREYLNTLLPKADLYLGLLAKDSLQTAPPLSFFRNFMVEKDGAYKDHFDLKLRAILPLVDSARVLALNSGIHNRNTSERFHKLAEIDSKNRTLLLQAANAMEYLLQLRYRYGFKNGDSGRYIQPDQLDKMDRIQLKEIFQLISDLQQIIEIRFQTAYLR